MTMPLNDRDEKVFADLRKINLRTPGVVKPAIVKLIRADFLTLKQIGDARLEWLRLGGQP